MRFRKRATKRPDEGWLLLTLICHILVTRGPRPESIAAALKLQHTSVQARIIRRLLTRIQRAGGEAPRFHVIFDKTTRVKSLASLPALKGVLDKYPSLHVVVADLPKIFSHCPSGNRTVLLAELLGHGDRIWAPFGHRFLKLSELPDPLRLLLMDPRAFRKERQRLLVKPLSDPAMRADRTEPARAESARVRGDRADELANHLASIRAELQGHTGHATLVEIAAAANARGLLTSRGKPIRIDTVSRLLKRLDPA